MTASSDTAYSRASFCLKQKIISILPAYFLPFPINPLRFYLVGGTFFRRFLFTFFTNQLYFLKILLAVTRLNQRPENRLLLIRVIHHFRMPLDA